MNRLELVNRVRRYFKTSELVCPHTISRFGEVRSWQFLDTDALHVLLVLREDILKIPLICNTATHTQRGLRCNCCEIVKKKTQEGVQYLSAHILGKGFDLVSNEMTAADMRARIKRYKYLLPCNVRIEADVNWLHIDTIDTGDRVYEFRA